MLRQAWISLGIWIAFGILIEGLIGFRTPALVDDSLRKDLFRLAHAHGTLLNLVLLVMAICARLDLVRPAHSAIVSLRLAAIFLPFGFLFGGLWHYSDDPGIGIVLVPIGALLLLFAAVQSAFSISNSNAVAAKKRS
jgi:hypothetical protein